MTGFTDEMVFEIALADISHIQARLCGKRPVLFLQTSHNTTLQIQQKCGMTSISGPWYDPLSTGNFDCYATI